MPNAVPPKVSKRRQTTDGGVTPGNRATAKEVPKGRQRQMRTDTKRITCSDTLSGLGLVADLVPKGCNYLCVLLHPRRLFTGKQ